jgi:hypothetical protein
VEVEAAAAAAAAADARGEDMATMTSAAPRPLRERTAASAPGTAAT